MIGDEDLTPPSAIIRQRKAMTKERKRIRVRQFFNNAANAANVTASLRCCVCGDESKICNFRRRRGTKEE